MSFNDEGTKNMRHSVALLNNSSILTHHDHDDMDSKKSSESPCCTDKSSVSNVQNSKGMPQESLSNVSKNNSASHQGTVNPMMFDATKSFLRFILPKTSFNLKEQLELHRVFTRDYPMLATFGFFMGQLTAFGIKKRFPQALKLQQQPHRVYLLFASLGFIGTVVTLPSLGYLMTFGLMRLDPSESPQSAILWAQKEENERRAEMKRLGTTKERKEYDWEDKEKAYVDIAKRMKDDKKRESV